MQQFQTHTNTIDKRVVLTYEKGVEMVMQYLDENIKHGDMKPFCEEHGISYASLSLIRGGYESAKQSGDFSQLSYNVKIISTILDIMEIPHNIEKPKPKSCFVINDPKTKEKIMEKIENNDEEYKKLVAQLERIDLVAFAKAYNYKIDEKQSLEYKGVIAVNHVTVMQHSGRKDDVIVISRYGSGVYGYFNPNDRLDAGNIIAFVKGRLLKWANAKETIKYIQEWVDENQIILEPIAVASGENLTLGDISEKEQATVQKNLIKSYFGLQPLEDKKPLKNKGISDHILTHSCFQNVIYNTTVKDSHDNVLFNNVAFPIYDLDTEGGAGLFVVGIQELMNEFHNPVSNYYENKETGFKTNFSELGFWLSAPAMKEWIVEHYRTHAYIGQTPLDCLAFAQQKLADLKENFFFISTVGAFDGQPEKLRKLQGLLETLGVSKVTLINKNTLEGQVANFLLSAQLYEPAPLVTDENGDTYRVKSEVQSFSPDISLTWISTGKALVTIKVYFASAQDKMQRMNAITGIIREIFTERVLVEGKFGWKTQDSKSVTGIFRVEVDSATLEKLQDMVEKIQPEKNLFMKIIRPQGLDFTIDLQEKKKLKQEEKQEQKQKNSVGMGLNLNIKK